MDAIRIRSAVSFHIIRYFLCVSGLEFKSTPTIRHPTLHVACARPPFVQQTMRWTVRGSASHAKSTSPDARLVSTARNFCLNAALAAAFRVIINPFAAKKRHVADVLYVPIKAWWSLLLNVIRCILGVITYMTRPPLGGTLFPYIPRSVRQRKISLTMATGSYRHRYQHHSSPWMKKSHLIE